MNNPTTIQNIRLFLISPSKMNPRKTFNQDELQELADNIARQGLLQPITVRPTEWYDEVQDGQTVSIPEKYEIVCGERRYRACSLNKMETIPCIVREMTDDEALDAMITENLQRKDVDPVEEAEAFTILSGKGQGVAELAARFGRSESYIRDRMRLVSLIDPLKKELSKGQITMRGAYLLSRLSEDDQNDFVKNEICLDEEGLVTTEDVTDWLDRKFMNLVRAPFQNGKDLTEEWNPKGKVVRRCQTCECNTCNHGCLFVDMKTDEPQCIDGVCYNRKCDIYYDRFIYQYASRITVAGNAIQPGDVAIRAGSVYGSEDKERLESLKEKMAQYGYRVFTEKELPQRVWDSEDNRKKALETGAAVEVIELDQMARQYRQPELVCYRLKSSVATSSPSDPHFLVARLCERSAAIKSKAEKEMTAQANMSFDKEKYISRKGELETWERIILNAIIFDKVPWDEQEKLIPGTRFEHATFQQMAGLRKENDSWMRRAISSFITGANKQDFLKAAAKRLDHVAESLFKKIQREADERIEAINEELRKMGYDENGNKI